MSESFSLSFVCRYCEEPLDVEQRKGAVYHDEVHECFGERVSLVAILYKDSISVSREGIRVEIGGRDD